MRHLFIGFLNWLLGIIMTFRLKRSEKRLLKSIEEQKKVIEKLYSDFDHNIISTVLDEIGIKVLNKPVKEFPKEFVKDNNLDNHIVSINKNDYYDYYVPKNKHLRTIHTLIISNEENRINLAIELLEKIDEEIKKDLIIYLDHNNWFLITSKKELLRYINYNIIDNNFIISNILLKSPLNVEIYESGKMDYRLKKLDELQIKIILTSSKLAELIWEDNKLDLSKLSKSDYQYYVEKYYKDPLNLF